MLDYINKLLDQKINKLDREHQFLQNSDKKLHRLLWRLFFKRPKRYLDIIASSALSKTGLTSKPKRIIHVVNLILPEDIKNESLRNRVKLTLESIETAKNKNVTLLGCSSKEISRDKWKIHKLNRDAKTEFGEKRDFAFLNDMLNAANSIAEKGDIIFYSNLDCPIHPDTYKNIFKENEGVTEFIRKDIQEVYSYKEIFDQPFKNYEIGVDGVAIKKELFEKSEQLFPDFVIGEPHWDTAISGILNQAYSVHQNTQDMYHIRHDQQWDDKNLSRAGQHNKKLYRDAVNYGLMPDELISIKKDCALILLKHSLSEENNKTIEVNLKKLTYLSRKYETVFCEYRDKDSPFKKHINKISYLPIIPTNDNVKKLNQKTCIVNLLRHYFCNHKYIIIIPEDHKIPKIDKINEIRESLRNSNKIKKSSYIALRTSGLEERPFDFFVENSDKKPNIKKSSFINDDGLLETINT